MMHEGLCNAGPSVHHGRGLMQWSQCTSVHHGLKIIKLVIAAAGAAIELPAAHIGDEHGEELAGGGHRC